MNVPVGAPKPNAPVENTPTGPELPAAPVDGEGAPNGDGAATPPKQWGGIGEALSHLFTQGDPMGAWGQLTGGGQMGVGLGGGLLLLMLLSRLFGGRGKQASLKDYTNEEIGHARYLLAKQAGVFYKDIEPDAIGLQMKTEGAPERPEEMFAMTERHREPRWLTKLWDNPGPNHERDYTTSMDQADQIAERNPTLYGEDVHPDRRQEMLISALLQQNFKHRYRNISPQGVLALSDLAKGRNMNVAVPKDIGEDVDKYVASLGESGQSDDMRAETMAKAAFTSPGVRPAPRFSRRGRGSRPEQKFVPGHRFQGSSSTRIQKMPAVRESGGDKAIDKMTMGKEAVSLPPNWRTLLGGALGLGAGAYGPLAFGAQPSLSTALPAMLTGMAGGGVADYHAMTSEGKKQQSKLRGKKPRDEQDERNLAVLDDIYQKQSAFQQLTKAAATYDQTGVAHFTSSPRGEVNPCDLAEKIAMKPLMMIRIRQQRIIAGKPKKTGSPSVKPSDNGTSSTTDMAKSKDRKGEFAVT